MARGDEHTVIIERRGRSHHARCVCGWAGHSWNELRPAEADAWHHVYGDTRVVDAVALSSGDDGNAVVLDGLLRSLSRAERAVSSAVPPQDPLPPAVERVVQRARALADGTSPYGDEAVREVWRVSGSDPGVVQAAIEEVAGLLRRHSRRSASTADSEWLQLHTTRRLLERAVAREDVAGY